MSDKDRAKKDHERTDKKNKAMREQENPRTQRDEEQIISHKKHKKVEN